MITDVNRPYHSLARGVSEIAMLQQSSFFLIVTGESCCLVPTPDM
jgi:hypothetical protein